MKTAIVTGAGGFIGRKLTESLAQKYVVYAIIYNEREKEGLPISNNVIPVTGDLNNWEDLAEKFPKGQPFDLFYHLAWGGISSAAYKDIDIQKNNIIMSICAARLACRVGCRKFIFAGTNQEYLVSPSKIDGTICNASVYGVCKKSARELCQVLLRDAMEFNATAFTNVFGPGDFSKRTANLFIGKLLRGEALDLIEGNHEYDWTFVDDAVAGLIAVGEKGVNGKQYYIGSRDLPTFRQILTEVRDTICPDAELRFGKYTDNTYTDYSKFDLGALYDDTGFECKSDFKESILNTANWLKSQLPKNIGGG